MEGKEVPDIAVMVGGNGKWRTMVLGSAET